MDGRKAWTNHGSKLRVWSVPCPSPCLNLERLQKGQKDERVDQAEKKKKFLWN
ncbi:hypothetical protein RvY_11393 [Ramazzottius varieornatus]|uniref:Uncharacterized protein n=1 Tax=Ramazzottius varieornatus TaxID=947166 RepID=A0A1D1VIE4_RAMVA|nr:hypothetical protein RvY_11393 [Ramazzottius varieornatus]